MSHENPERDPELEARLARHLNGCRMGRSVYAFEQLGSTMEHAHALAREGAPEGTLVVTLRQNQGRGRLGRVWESPVGGAYFSLIVRPTRELSDVPQLSLLAGLSAAEAIQRSTGLYPSLRWPNDVLLNGNKVAGILVEAKASAVILGVGINVTTRTDELPDTATSLQAGGARAVDPLVLTASLCQQFQAWYDVWTAEGFASIREALRPWMGHFGQPVHISAGSQQFEGTASDVDENGRLMVRLDSGLIRTFDVGEVTLLR